MYFWVPRVTTVHEPRQSQVPKFETKYMFSIKCLNE